MLVVKDLKKDFGSVRAIDDISFRVKKGERVGLIGPNGAGKTTLLNVLSGACLPNSGTIVFDGVDVTRCPPFRRCRLGISRTYQIPRPFQRLTVFENLLVAAMHGGAMEERAAREHASDILNLTGLLERKDCLAADLSLVDRKHLELGRALATRPQLLLLDEVASGLSAAEFERMLELIGHVNGNDLTVLWIEHVPMMLFRGVERMMFLSQGKLLFSGTPEELVDRPEFVNLYLGSALDGPS